MAGNTTQLHNTGEEYIFKVVMDRSVVAVATVSVGLFNDSVDNLNADSDLADITTEPDDGNYSRQTINLNDTDVTVRLEAGHWEAVLAQIEFDVEDTTGTVDSYFIVINFEAAGDGSPTDHLFWTGDLDQSRDLSQIDVFRINADTAGLRIEPCDES
jgi:hypothetical protein